MIGNLTIGQYFPGNSLLHRLDSRVKIISVMLFIIALFIVSNGAGYILLTGYTVVAAGLSAIPAKVLVRGLKPLRWFVVFTLVVHFFLTPGTVVWQWRAIALTVEGINQGVFMTLRLLLLIFLSSLLTLTTSPTNLTDGIECILFPLHYIGVPAHEIAMMMTIALRFIPTLLEEADKIVKAQTARGADFATGNIMARAANMVPILVPLFISSFRRADELALAMESRCYRGGQGRTRMREMKVGLADIGALMVTGGVVAGAVLLRIF